jgi:L-ascorbate peroxidase
MPANLAFALHLFLFLQVPVGRRDATGPDPDGRMPEQTANAQQQLANFAAKGLGPQELMVLSGSHTVRTDCRLHSFSSCKSCCHLACPPACQPACSPACLPFMPASLPCLQLGSKGYGDPVTFDNTYFKTLLQRPWVGMPEDMAQHIGGWWGAVVRCGCVGVIAP